MSRARLRRLERLAARANPPPPLTTEQVDMIYAEAVARLDAGDPALRDQLNRLLAAIGWEPCER